MTSSPPSARRAPPSPATVARARALVEGTALPQRAILRETGLGIRALRRLIREEGWRRPDGAPRGSMPPERLARLRALAEGTRLTQRAIARELRVHPNTVSLRIRRHGWVRPPPEVRDGAPVAVRWPKRPGRPFRADVVPAVRALYVGTTLSLKAIAARTGVSFPMSASSGTVTAGSGRMARRAATAPAAPTGRTSFPG